MPNAPKEGPKGAKKALWIAALALLALAVLLYFFHPLAPVFLLLSVAIQLPLIYVIVRVSFSSGYADRVYERKQRFEKDGDAAAWLAEEEREARGVGFRYWSAKSRNKNALLRAGLLQKLGREADAKQALAEVLPAKLRGEDKAEYDCLVFSL